MVPVSQPFRLHDHPQTPVTGREKRMGDVQKMVATAVTTPRGSLVATRNNLEIQLDRANDLKEALAGAAAVGFVEMDFAFCFFEDGDASCKVSQRRRARGCKASKRAVDAAIDRVRDLLEDAIREALQEEFDFDRQIRVGVGLDFDAKKASWDLNGSATAYDIALDLNDVEVRFA
jgi:hypothetical protein